MRVFRCTAFAHKEETQRSNKLGSHGVMGMYIGSRDFMHRIYFPGKQKLVFTKQGAFLEGKTSLLFRRLGSVYIEEEHRVRQRTNESMTSSRQVPRMPQNKFQENDSAQLSEELSIQQVEDSQDGNNMENESLDNNGLPSEQALAANRGR